MFCANIPDFLFTALCSPQIWVMDLCRLKTAEGTVCENVFGLFWKIKKLWKWHCEEQYPTFLLDMLARSAVYRNFFYHCYPEGICNTSEKATRIGNTTKLRGKIYIYKYICDVTVCYGVEKWNLDAKISCENAIISRETDKLKVVFKWPATHKKRDAVNCPREMWKTLREGAVDAGGTEGISKQIGRWHSWVERYSDCRASGNDNKRWTHNAPSATAAVTNNCSRPFLSLCPWCWLAAVDCEHSFNQSFQTLDENKWERTSEEQTLKHSSLSAQRRNWNKAHQDKTKKKPSSPQQQQRQRGLECQQRTWRVRVFSKLSKSSTFVHRGALVRHRQRPCLPNISKDGVYLFYYFY